MPSSASAGPPVSRKAVPHPLLRKSDELVFHFINEKHTCGPEAAGQLELGALQPEAELSVFLVRAA